MTIKETLDNLASTGNLRRIPADTTADSVTDLSTNDYLGLAARSDLQQEFLARQTASPSGMTSSASRLLAASQHSYARLEQLLSELYGGGKALLFNSGYHANTGLVSALAGDSSVTVIADRLVHASIIDGMVLAKKPFERFRHNDLAHLERLVEKHRDSERLLVIVESVYSMDGDRADIDALIDLKRRHPQIMLYVDEAHALGVEGPAGLGLCAATGHADEVDVIVGTFGKALASSGAFCITSAEVREYLVNRARSLIFSTALPPICADWTTLMMQTMTQMDTERAHLRELASVLHDAIMPLSPDFSIAKSHIQPLVIGNAQLTVDFSHRLLEEGFKVLPIRTPTVPPGTERLRISLSAALSTSEISALAASLTKIMKPCECND